MKKYYSFCILIILSIIEIQVQTSCANIIPPTGGPKDSLPPVLVLAIPKDSTLNFKANKITLTFDEYIQLDNQAVQTSLVVSPNPEITPIITAHLKDINIRLKDSLRPNTTYSINFGKALKDNNEGNIAKNFLYVFSTGDHIVNGRLSGKVQLAENGKTDSTLIVVLHSNLNDSAVKKLRPDYYATLDSLGRFKFQYVAYGKYAVYVLPNDYTKRYDDSTKMFAFLEEPVAIDSVSSTEPVTLYAYNEYKASKENGGSKGGGGKPQQPSGQPSKKKPGNDNDTPKVIKYTMALDNGHQDLLSNLDISFPEKLATFDSSKISLTDSNFKPVSNYKIVADTSFQKFTLQHPWKEGEYFRLIIQQDAFVDSSGKMLAKTDTLKFQTANESEYGSVRLRFPTIDLSLNPVVQFIQNDKVIDSAALTGIEFYRKLYKPGDYELRILYDEDKNLTWTAGSFDLKRQPEIVIRLPRKFTVKKNWDNEGEINL
ncbi:Ig-like domain-containing protein [Parafilimonas sp.]|uniref:Ig-like domain-containing protein n=1 Tax=Parafilimonas sp. TaxID=1969739 RepID=UPI0039E39B7C